MELRSKIQQVYVERRPSLIDEVEWPTPSGEVAHLEVQVVPLVDDQQTLLGASITFADVTRSRRFKEELEHANQELESAYDELQSTNEELETTNEELQSTVEELETTNEELQSTNEELETMNEELQSTNEELQTINDELGQRTAELNQLNAFLESIWAGLDGRRRRPRPRPPGAGVEPRLEDLWGVRQEEVQGQHFLNLDIGLPVDQVRPALRAAMSGENGTQSTSDPGRQPARQDRDLPGHLQPPARQRQDPPRGDRGRGRRTRRAAGGQLIRTASGPPGQGEGVRSLVMAGPRPASAAGCGRPRPSGDRTAAPGP